jgi:hypothetical protein
MENYLSPTTPCFEMNPDGKWKRKTVGADGQLLKDFHTQVLNWYGARL